MYGILSQKLYIIDFILHRYVKTPLKKWKGFIVEYLQYYLKKLGVKFIFKYMYLPIDKHKTKIKFQIMTGN